MPKMGVMIVYRVRWSREPTAVYPEGKTMFSKREIFLQKVDAGIIRNHPYTAEQMQRIRYPIKNLLYDEECWVCNTRFMIDHDTGFKECVTCHYLYKTGLKPASEKK